MIENSLLKLCLTIKITLCYLMHMPDSYIPLYLEMFRAISSGPGLTLCIMCSASSSILLTEQMLIIYILTYSAGAARTLFLHVTPWLALEKAVSRQPAAGDPSRDCLIFKVVSAPESHLAVTPGLRTSRDQRGRRNEPSEQEDQLQHSLPGAPNTARGVSQSSLFSSPILLLHHSLTRTDPSQIAWILRCHVNIYLFWWT